MTLLAGLAGGGVVLGLWLVLDGLHPTSSPSPALPRVGPVIDRRRLLVATVAAALLLVLTRWPVAVPAGLALGWYLPNLFGNKGVQAREIARTEAIASWTEMLRDTLAGAHGLEEAVVTSAQVAPEPIHAEVSALAMRLRRQPLREALEEFDRDLSHPIGDLVVTALTLAAGGSSGDLRELLGTLAVSARDEASMRLRVEATRARLHTAVRVIAMCTGATALGLVVLSRSYLSSYASATGQIVLAIVLLAWGVALYWLSRMGDYMAPERFLASADGADQ